MDLDFGSVEEPTAIDASQALTMDNLIPAPLCTTLIKCVHAPPLVSTSNQLLLTSAVRAASLLITEPSFPPVMEGKFSTLPGAPIVFSGAQGAPVAPSAPYSTIQSRSATHFSLWALSHKGWTVYISSILSIYSHYKDMYD